MMPVRNENSMKASLEKEIVNSCGTIQSCPFYEPSLEGVVEQCKWNEDYECTNNNAIKTVSLKLYIAWFKHPAEDIFLGVFDSEEKANSRLAGDKKNNGYYEQYFEVEEAEVNKSYNL